MFFIKQNLIFISHFINCIIYTTGFKIWNCGLVCNRNQPYLISAPFKVEVDIETPQASEITPIIPLQTTNLPPQIFRASTTTRRPYVTTTLGPVGHNHVQPSRSKFSISRSFHLDPTQAAGDSPFRYRNSYL